MKAFLGLFHQGGLPIVAIAVLSVVLYWRSFRLLWQLRRARGHLTRLATGSVERIEEARVEVQEEFREQRISLAAMIAAAPLLGLLGTVSGMSKTFESLGSGAAAKSMEGLARGISEVLVATEAGLMVAIPAMVLLFLAHREARGHCEALARLSHRRRASP